MWRGWTTKKSFMGGAKGWAAAPRRRGPGGGGRQPGRVGSRWGGWVAPVAGGRAAIRPDSNVCDGIARRDRRGHRHRYRGRDFEVGAASAAVNRDRLWIF